MKNPSGSEIMDVAARDRLHRPFPLREKNGQSWRIRVHGSIRKDWIKGARTGCARSIKAIGVPTWTGGGLIPGEDANFYSDNELALHPRGRNISREAGI